MLQKENNHNQARIQTYCSIKAGCRKKVLTAFLGILVSMVPITIGQHLTSVVNVLLLNSYQD